MEHAVRLPGKPGEDPCRRIHPGQAVAVISRLGKAGRMAGKKSWQTGKTGTVKGGFEIRTRPGCPSAKNGKGR